MSEEVGSSLRELTERYRSILSEGKEGEFSEGDVGSKFVLPLLSCLGWDIRKIEEVQEQKRTLHGIVDYSLNIEGRPKILVEIKKFTHNLDDYQMIRGRKRTYPEQAMQYAWEMKVDWVVLTNFKELRLYYSLVKNPSEGLILKIKWNEFLERFEDFWLISKDSVLSNRLEIKRKKQTRDPLETEFLTDLLICRRKIAQDIHRSIPELSLEELREIIQRILDRIFFIIVAEYRGVERFEGLWNL